MELHAIDKLIDEVDMLERVYYSEPSKEQLMLTLSLAKRVRRCATEVIRELATERDQATAQEAQADE
jgi:hypothetical protein